MKSLAPTPLTFTVVIPVMVMSYAASKTAVVAPNPVLTVVDSVDVLSNLLTEP